MSLRKGKIMYTIFNSSPLPPACPVLTACWWRLVRRPAMVTNHARPVANTPEFLITSTDNHKSKGAVPEYLADNFLIVEIPARAHALKSCNKIQLEIAEISLGAEKDDYYTLPTIPIFFYSQYLR